MAAAYWRLRRAWRFEAQAIRDYREQPPAADPHNPAAPEAQPRNANLPSTPDLEKLIRYESAIEREIFRVMRELTAGNAKKSKRQQVKREVLRSEC